MRTPSRPLVAAAAAASIVATAILAGTNGTAAATAAKTRVGPVACRGIEHLAVSGAERLEYACLADLTTTGTIATGHTDSNEFTGFGGLSVPGAIKPAPVPGIQLDGYFPDTSAFNTTHGWNHDAQFVIRLPRQWNGGLVVAGPPGLRQQYASDVIISDTVLAKGYAYASTDKGNSGLQIYNDGVQPGDAIAEWHSRLTELTIAAKDVIAQRYHQEPRRTYVAGFSAAGYLARWQLENRPRLYDGGVAWSGVLMTPERNLLTYLPSALRHYPQYVATGSPDAHQAMLEAGFPAGSEPTWAYSYRFFWDPLQRTLREEMDPGYDGDTLAGHPFCASGSIDCEADYELGARPAEVKDAFKRIALTGRIGKPLLELQGSLDTAVTPRDSRLYSTMVTNQGRGAMTRLYEVEGGSHFEALYGRFPSLLRPMLPCFQDVFGALEDWTTDGTPPPASHVVTRGGTTDLVNTCTI
jgi:Tannase and feruloyl esterase